MNKYQRIAKIIPSQEQERTVKAHAIEQLSKHTKDALKSARTKYRRASKKVSQETNAEESVDTKAPARRRLPKRDIIEE